MFFNRRCHLIFNLFYLATLNLLTGAQTETWQINLNFATNQYQAIQLNKIGQEKAINLGSDPINKLQNLKRRLALFKQNPTEMPEILRITIWKETDQEEFFTINKQDALRFVSEPLSFKKNPLEVPLEHIRQKIQTLQSTATESTMQPITPPTTPETPAIHKDLQDEEKASVRAPIEFSDTPQALAEGPDTYSDDIIAFVLQEQESERDRPSPSPRFRRPLPAGRPVVIGTMAAIGVLAILGIPKIHRKWSPKRSKRPFRPTIDLKSDYINSI